MSEESKTVLKDGLRYLSIVILIGVCLLMLIAQYLFPREGKTDKESLVKIEQIVSVFGEMKTQNEKILQINQDINKNLETLLKEREGKRDQAYQDLLKRYGETK